MKTNMKVLLGVLALAVIGAAVYFSKSELQKGATRRPVGPQPDYEISSIIVDPANPIEGENFKISVTVKNKSSTTAATVPSKTLLHLNGQPLPIATTQPLGPLATEEEIWQTTSTQRRLLIRSCADADRAIAESNERNNCRERTLDLLPPPLPPPPPPLPLCAEGQYNCESWTECSAEGSQTGTICRPNSPGTCLAPLGPTRACTPPPPPMPDLVIEDISIINQDPDGMINFRVRVRNAGNAPVTVVEDSPSTNPAIREETIDAAHNVVLERAGTVGTTECLSVSSEGRPIDCRRSFTIEPGEIITSNSFARGNNPNTGQLSGGGVGIRLTVDYAGNVTESDETNNSFDFMVPASYLTFRPPPPMPDLVIDSVTVVQDRYGVIYASSVTIRNAGNLAITNGNTNPTFIRISSILIDSAGNTFPGSSVIRMLYSCSSTTPTICSISYTISPGTAINYSGAINGYSPEAWRRAGVAGIRLIVDSTNVVSESNETNNTYDIAIPTEFLAWVAPPDLQIDSITTFHSPPSSPLIAGNPLYFSSMLWNAGSTTAPASTTTLTINGTGTVAALGEVYRQDISTPALAPGQGETLDDDLEGWPSPIEGSFIVTICADSGSVVSENSRWNNCAVRFFRVEPATSE